MGAGASKSGCAVRTLDGEQVVEQMQRAVCFVNQIHRSCLIEIGGPVD
jgi:hypothetical protein